MFTGRISHKTEAFVLSLATSFSASNLECSCSDSPGQDASPSQVPSQQCLYSSAAEYTEANWGNEIACASNRSMPGVGIELTTLESSVQHCNH